MTWHLAFLFSRATFRFSDNRLQSEVFLLFAAKCDMGFWCYIVFTKMQYISFFSEKFAKILVWCVMALSILPRPGQFYVCLIADFSLKCCCYLQPYVTWDFGAISFLLKCNKFNFFWKICKNNSLVCHGTYHCYLAGPVLSFSDSRLQPEVLVLFAAKYDMRFWCYIVFTKMQYI